MIHNLIYNTFMTYCILHSFAYSITAYYILHSFAYSITAYCILHCFAYSITAYCILHSFAYSITAYCIHHSFAYSITTYYMLYSCSYSFKIYYILCCWQHTLVLSSFTAAGYALTLPLYFHSCQMLSAWNTLPRSARILSRVSLLHWLFPAARRKIPMSS